MKIPQDEIEKANAINLPQFLIQNGFDLKKVGSHEYVWKEHNSLHIKDNAPGERGQWYRFSTQQGGDNIAFLREFMGVEFNKAVEMLNGVQYDFERKETYEKRNSMKENKHISFNQNSDSKRVIAYLCKTRGLDYQLVSSLVKEGKIAQEEKTGNAVFKCVDEKGQLVGLEKVGTSTEHKFKGIATGSASGYGFEVCRGNGENLFFFESAIDMLSFLQMHDKNLDNCRLVSMMGVKPQTVIDTMKKNGISAENVHLCSDNDKAGNEFAKRLQEKFPQMKRLATPDDFKDWNDMLRGIKKEKENEKMRFYGNQIWNDLTDNKDKSVISVDIKTFAEKLDLLENSGLNFYAYSTKNSVKIAVNDTDINLLKTAFGDDINVEKSSRDYSPGSPIIGNKGYYDIRSKQFLRTNKDTALKVAELLTRTGVEFSGRIYPNGKATLTVSDRDLEAAQKLMQDVYFMRKSFNERTEKSTLTMTKVGKFFEMYNDNAEIAADVLQLYMFEKNGSPMIGFPVSKKDEYTQILENAGYIVNEQEEMLTADNSREELQNEIDEPTEQTEELQNEIADISAAEENAVDDKVEAAEPTEEEKLFMQADVCKLLARDSLSSDEWEDLASPMFERGYLERRTPNSKVILGNGLKEETLFDIAKRFQSGEDVRKELALGLMPHKGSSNIKFAFKDDELTNRTYLYDKSLCHNLHVEYGEDSVKVSFENVQREISYEEIGQKYIDLIHEEFDDLMYWAVLDYIKDDIPDISDDTVKNLISAFDGAAMADWEKGDNQPKINRIKKALYDILGDEAQTEQVFAIIAKEKYNVTFEPERKPDSLEFQFGYSKDGKDRWFTESGLLSDFAEEHGEISFALANALMEYLDDKQHRERMIPDLNAGYYKKTNFEIRAVADGQEFNFSNRFDIGDGKGSGGGSLIDHIRTVCENAIASTAYPYNTPESKETPRNMLNVLVPYLEAHSALTAEEQKILDDFKEKNPIRTIDDVEKAQGTFKIYQLPSGEKYHGVRFEGLDKAKWLINDFCEAEYRGSADFDDLHHVSLAHTTLTDDELPIQVTADLVDFKITHEFDGEVFDTEQFDSIEDMIKNGLTGLDFSDLVSVPDEVIDRHTGKDEQTVDLMSDATDISDTSSTSDDVPAVTLKYKGDAESLDEIKDKALSLGATVIVDNAEGIISIDTYEHHQAELDGLAYELGIMRVDDVPSVSEDIDIEGEQLSLFGDPEPLTASKPAPQKSKSEFSAGPVVDGVQVFEALAAEIDRGTGFVNGKIRVQDFYEKSKSEPNHPTTQELADFLKKEYGIGGHSGEGNISLVDYDSKGMTFSFENGEKFRHSWHDVAVMTESRLKDNTYLSPEQQEQWQTMKAERSAEENFEPYKVEIGDKFRNKATGVVSEVVSLTGALPYYTDDCTVKRLSGAFEITENISYDKLLNSGLYEYIGRNEPEKEQSAPVKPEKAEVTPDKPAVNSETEKPKEKMTAPEKGENFTITDDNLGDGGAKTKFRANVDAIRTLKTLEAENRPATDEEKEILSKYVGWGGLAKAFDSSEKSWESEYTQLKNLLTDEEYSSARASTLDAFYTPPVVVESIYKALENFGFKGGNVLEPSLGVGNFLGKMPSDMAEKSKVYGTEIDSISGRIAQKIYPNADIKIEGFEKNNYQNNSFDVAVGNVPFGDLGFKDKKHGTSQLHDYFFLETLDKVKNGGIVAFVTSMGTLDKKDKATREKLSQNAELVGAIRLPSGTFSKNAGTEVTSDIIFLKKKEHNSEPADWVNRGEINGLAINKYFEQNPDMILGDLVYDSNPFSSGTKVVAGKDFDLKSALDTAVGKLSATISTEKTKEVYNKVADLKDASSIPNMTFFENNGKAFYKGIYGEISNINDGKKAEKICDYIKLREALQDLIKEQQLNGSDENIKVLQDKLNSQYENFTKKYGILHNNKNKSALKDDVAYPLVASLESTIENGKVTKKSDLFTKRTIRPAKAVEHVNTSMEALTLSISERGKVDFEYMQKLTDFSKEDIISDLKGEIYPVPYSNEYQTASEYLSGDIRKKIDIAKEDLAYSGDSRLKENIKALENVLPAPLKAADIDVKIGATWINPKYYEDFMYQTFGTPYDKQRGARNYWKKTSKIKADYSEYTNKWSISNKRTHNSVTVSTEYGTDKLNAYQIFESLLNLKDPKVNKTIRKDGKEQRVPDIEATKNAQRKAEKIKKAFAGWIFEDPDRRDDIVNTYNKKFNSIRPREYDGSALNFPEMNAQINLHEHQKNAVAHAMFGGNTLFAHSVGAGKTFEMIAAAMESKRLGLCTKSLFAVPNHLTEQIGEDFRKLYPNAKILVAEKSDFKKENRQQLFAKIATGNFDAVIIGHSQLGLIKMSKERQESILQSQIDDVLRGIADLKAQDGSKFEIKAMERTRKSLQKNLEALKKEKQDDTVTFEQMGIDKLIVDEAHEFKNLFTPTKLQNLSGVSTSASQKAMDLFMKCRYLDEKTGGKGVILATGTPLSNSITELHTMMRYLEYDFLKDKGLQNFDNWITVFGEQKTDWELAPAGNKFRQKTRIANYTGLPELMSMFKQVADIRTPETLKLDVPDCETHIVNVEATDLQKEMVTELSDRADDVQDNKVDPSVDNMLKITSDGRKLGLDPRLIDPSFEDNPNTKLNKCVENVFKIYEDTMENKSAQIVFCDLGVPHSDKTFTKKDDEKSSAEVESLEEECDFCVYDDIKQKLINKGVPENEIAYIHSAKTEAQKSELFAKVRSGEVRVLLGSTSKMGTGTNVQDKLIAVHDLDIPWRPADLEQRAGRVVRQGNENKNVHIYRYVTKGTFDAYSYQTLENKQKFISQIMTNKSPVRKCEDVDKQSLSYGEIKALCTGDERIKEKMTLENEVKDLRFEKAEYNNNRYDMQDKVRKFPEIKEKREQTISALTKDLQHIRGLETDPETQMPKFEITIGNQTFTDKTEAAKALEKACTGLGNLNEPKVIGTFHGFPLKVYFQSEYLSEKKMTTLTAELSGNAKHICEFTGSFPHNLKKLDNLATVDNISYRIDNVAEALAKETVDFQTAQKILNEPFAHEAELTKKEERLSELTEELNQEAILKKAEKNNTQKTFHFKQADFDKIIRKEKFKEKQGQKVEKKEKSQHKRSDECLD